MFLLLFGEYGDDDGCISAKRRSLLPHMVLVFKKEAVKDRFGAWVDLRKRKRSIVMRGAFSLIPNA